MKLLLWLAVIWIGVLWFMHLKKSKLAAARRAGMPGSDVPRVAEAMVPCATCGVHLPRSEALVSLNGKEAWCCEEHRRQHPGSATP